MKRIHSIDLKHFKAFQDTPPIELEGKNLLLYGPNGSGKSSIFWALYTFLQSSQKPSADVQKYFDPSHRESLVNIDMAESASSSIVLHMGEGTDGESAVPVRIALDTHETPVPDWQKANLASDFVTYRILFRFYHFTNSEEIDLWPVFFSEVLPFCSASLAGNLADAWADVFRDDPYHEAQRQKARGRAAAGIYDKYERRLGDFQVGLEGTLDSIQKAAQEFYNQHFTQDGEKPLKMALRLTWPQSYDRKKHVLTVPKIGLGITLGDKPILMPQSFLNEAKLTQIALSVRFGATKANLQDAPMKLLVLDDLLISLDMSNRMQVIKIILSDEDFADYQKIIMTHDREFYSEIRRQIGTAHHKWVYGELHCTDGNAPELREQPDKIALAEALLREGRYDEVALQLRKSAEETLRQFTNNYPDSGDFKSLSDLLRQARRNLERTALNELRKLLDDPDLDEATLQLIIPNNMSDLVSNEALSAEQKTRCCGRRTALRKLLAALHPEGRLAISVLAQIDHVKDRILNPAAHAGNTPLYEGEMEDALELVRRLKDVLPSGV